MADSRCDTTDDVEEDKDMSQEVRFQVLGACVVAAWAMTRSGELSQVRVSVTQGQALRQTGGEGHGFWGGIDEETAEILSDPETLALLRESEEDMREGRIVDGDALRANPRP